ncbi:hypothetical protein AAXE64_27160 [Priestia megaterium]|uniref:hypothetical protein n=1 Tax=Priestia megaterium TaxID=1404 RepID=UPI003CFBF050
MPFNLEDFLSHLAERKYMHYHNLFVAKPVAYTSDEMHKRIQRLAEYQEVINIIEHLPLEHKRFVDKEYEDRRACHD